MSVDAPGRLPASTSALFTQSLSVCPVQPILGAIDRIVAQRDGCSCSCSSTRRRARLRTSGENLFVVLLMAAPPSQELEPPANPGRFSVGCIGLQKADEIIQLCRDRLAARFTNVRY